MELSTETLHVLMLLRILRAFYPFDVDGEEWDFVNLDKAREEILPMMDITLKDWRGHISALEKAGVYENRFGPASDRIIWGAVKLWD